jgi:hypothetical protein
MKRFKRTILFCKTNPNFEFEFGTELFGQETNSNSSEINEY